MSKQYYTEREIRIAKNAYRKGHVDGVNNTWNREGYITKLKKKNIYPSKSEKKEGE